MLRILLIGPQIIFLTENFRGLASVFLPLLRKTKIYLRLPQTHKIPRRRDVCVVCGPYRIRTGDLLIANEALYQLS